MRAMSKEAFDIRALEPGDQRRTFSVERDEAGMRLDAFLHKRLPWLSRARIQSLEAVREPSMARGEQERKTLKKSARTQEGDRIEVRLPQNPKDAELALRDPPLKSVNKLFEDEAILAIDKPAGVPVHPVGMNLHRTVLTALHRMYRRPDDPERDVAPRLVHRLDVETSGVLLAAKTDEALRDRTGQFRRRTVRKIYIAVVYGTVEADSGEIDLPIGPDEKARVPYKRKVDSQEGRRAVTRYETLLRDRGLTWLRLKPETGRKHQLRVHLAALGHPIVGDKIYGPDEAYYFKAREGPMSLEDLKELLLPRQALHAFRLELRHPVTGRALCLEAPVPEDMKTLLKESSNKELISF